MSLYPSYIKIGFLYFAGIAPYEDDQGRENFHVGEWKEAPEDMLVLNR